MTQRKEVFQSKVLQKLYPPAPKREKDPSPPHIEALAQKDLVKTACKKKTLSGDGGMTQSMANPIRRYTVLPLPADYKTSLERSATLPQPESINNAKDPAENSCHESCEEHDQAKEAGEEKRRRRRKKRTVIVQEDSVKDGSAPLSNSSTGQIPADQGRERLSRNKKRKLKKKRHKEKLLSMGLVPRAAALEFTYQREEDEEEEEEEEEEDEDERRAAEVSEFLRTTMEIFMSDSSLNVDKLPPLSMANLLSNITSGRKPASVLKQLHSLKVFVQQKEPDKLSKALEELPSTSSMSPGQ
ncbi:hypothetical protein LDENG_00152210 [Lucifuga dentata]|nr:hypothetical protein LDENG_00152210 [Lucifuga dentata]